MAFSLDWIEQGGPVMYPILGCSLLSVTITIERALFWMRVRRNRDQKAVDRVNALVAAGEIEKATAAASRSRDAIARVCRFALSHHHESIEAALQIGVAEEIRRMRKFLKIHDTIVTLAPLLGILGTVLGIISTFEVISGGNVEDPVAVSGGIAEALITTAAGLVVAMLSVVPYNYFTARMEDAITEMESHLTNFEIMYRKGRDLVEGQVPA